MSSVNDTRAVIFDFDMTLADSSHAIHKCTNLVAAKFGLPTISRERVLEGIGLPVEESWRLYWGDYKDEWLAYYRENFRGLEQSEIRLFTNVLSALSKLRAAGVKTGVASNRRFARKVVEGVGLAPYMDAVVGLEDITKAKPDPEALFTAMGRLGAGAENSFYVGDTDIDMKTSVAASVRGIGSTTGYFGKEKLAGAGAWRVVADIAEVPPLLGIE